jgi:hypothetical protein
MLIAVNGIVIVPATETACEQVDSGTAEIVCFLKCRVEGDIL